MTGTSSIDRLPIPGAGFVWEAFHDTVLLRPETDAVRAAFTTRVGGLSEAAFASWNMSYAVGDERRRVDANRELANESIERPGVASWGRIRQVHGTDVVRAQHGDLIPADAVWTDDPDEVVAVFGADCVPVLLVGGRRVAAAHGGWRGLVAGIVESAARVVGAEAAWIGPGIGPCCFEVREDAARPLRERFGRGVMRDERHADLWAAAEAASRDAGIRRVHVARLCTSCNADLFFSHRRDRGRTGRQALVARHA